MYTYKEKFDPKFKEAIEKGYQLCDKIWPITQQLNFYTCTGRSYNGYCVAAGKNQCDIHINRLLKNKEDIVNTVIHEILHSYPETLAQARRGVIHRGEWARRAAIIKQKYGINITRCSYKEKTIPKEVKFQFGCSKCQKTWNYYKTPKWIHHMNAAKCPVCHTTTIVLLKGKMPPMVLKSI